MLTVFSSHAIDLNWSSFYGGTETDNAYSITTDKNGNIFLAGITNSSNNISTPGSYKPNWNQTQEVFIAKFSADGVRQWATYFGGEGEEDLGSIKTDDTGNVYIVGSTTSKTDIAFNGIQNTFGGGNRDAFLTKFDTNGNLNWSTYLGTSNDEFGLDLDINSLNNILVLGYIYQPPNPNNNTPANYYSFVSEYASNGTSTWNYALNGNGFDLGTSIFIDGNNEIYFCGTTTSTTGISTNDAYQSSNNGGNDAYLIKLDAKGALLYGTYYGGNNFDIPYEVIVDSDNNIYLTGYTTSTNNIAFNGYDVTYGGGRDAFLVKFQNTSKLEWSTYYGGASEEIGYDMIINPANEIVIAGNTKSSTNIASANAYQTTLSGTEDGLIVKFGQAGERIWGTYFGGASEERVYSLEAKPGELLFGCGTAGAGLPSGGGGGVPQLTYGGGTSDGYIAAFKDMYITDFTPKTGPVGTTVTIEGMNFSGVTDVKFNGVTAEFTIIDNEKIEAKVPGSAVSGPITITSPTSSANSKEDFVVCNLPSSTGITGPQASCVGTNELYSVALVSGESYQWTLSGGGIISGSGNEISISWDKTGTYTLSVLKSNSCGIGQSIEYNVEVFEVPNPPTAIQGETEVCFGLKTYSVADPNLDYEWSISGGGTLIQNGNQAEITWNANGTHTISVLSKNSCGESSPSELIITVDNGPGFSGNISGTDNACVGSKEDYSVTQVNGISYNWKISGGGTISGSGPSVVIEWTTTGTHEIEMIPSNKCKELISIKKTVIISEVPTSPISISGETNVCFGEYTYSVPASINTYSWQITGGGDILSNTGNIIKINWNAVGTHTITVTPSNDCGDGPSKTLNVDVDSGSTFTGEISGKDEVCTGTIENYSVPKIDGINYSWSVSGGGALTENGNAAVINWTSTGNFEIEMTPSSSCGNLPPVTLQVAVGKIPSTPSTINGPDIVCFGNQTYEVNDIADATFSWSIDGVEIPNETNNTLIQNWDMSGDYILSVSANSSCGTSPERSLNVKVSGDINAITTIDGPSGVCTGMYSYSVLLFENTSYKWNLSSGGTMTVNNNEVSINWTDLGIHTLSMTPTYSCGNGPQVMLEINVDLPPEKPVITGVANVLTSSIEEGNQWYYNGNAIPDASEQSYVAFFVDLDYTVSVTTGCGTAFSDPYNILVSGIDENALQSDDFNVYPNPSNHGNFVLSWSNKDLNLRRISVIDITGKTIFIQKDVKDGFTLNLSHQPRGLYQLIAEAEGMEIRKKLIIR